MTQNTKNIWFIEKKKVIWDDLFGIANILMLIEYWSFKVIPHESRPLLKKLSVAMNLYFDYALHPDEMGLILPVLSHS